MKPSPNSRGAEIPARRCCAQSASCHENLRSRHRLQLHLSTSPPLHRVSALAPPPPLTLLFVTQRSSCSRATASLPLAKPLFVMELTPLISHIASSTRSNIEVLLNLVQSQQAELLRLRQQVQELQHGPHHQQQQQQAAPETMAAVRSASSSPNSSSDHSTSRVHSSSRSSAGSRSLCPLRL